MPLELSARIDTGDITPLDQHLNTAEPDVNLGKRLFASLLPLLMQGEDTYDPPHRSFGCSL